MRPMSCTVLFALAAVGCGGAMEDAAPTGTPAPAAVASVDDNLARLRALQVFSVGDLVVQQPREAYSCYGPCPGADAAVAQARADAAARLDRFTHAAATAAAATVPPTDPAAPACATATVDANLAALRALQVVTVGDLLTVVGHESANCYNTVCPEDRAAAALATCARASQLAQITAATRGL